MKKDKLYTVGGNIQAKKLYPDGGFLPMPQNYNWGKGLVLPSFQVAQVHPLSSETIGKVNDLYNKISKTTPQEASNSQSGFYNTASKMLTAASPGIVALGSDGYSTNGVGEGIATAFNTAGDLVGTIPGVGTAASLALKGIGLGAGIVANRGWGVKENKENTAALKENRASARAAGSGFSNVNNTTDYFNASGNMTSSLGFKASDLYKNGWWTDKGTEMGNAANTGEARDIAYQNHAGATAALRVDANQDSNTKRGFIAAFGGPLDYLGNNDMGAIEYGFMKDYLTQREKQIDSKNKLTGISPINAFCGGGRIFDFGGNVGTNSSDFPTGLTHIDAGGSHEMNPNEGVQVGVDQEGTPNLVEEGETIFNDYVFSNRIKLDDEAKKAFHIGKKRDITYAEMSKKLEKEASERPNDPISKAALKAQLQELAEHQERQKQEMEAERAREAFEALSPEEQTAVMQQVAQQEQAAQEQAMQEEAMAQQQAQGQQMQMSPEEAAMMQQQQMQGQPMMGQPEVVQGQPMMAYGGKVNRFDGGGATNKILNALGIHTKEGFESLLKELKLLDDKSTYKLWEDDGAINSDTFKWLLNHKDFRNKVAKDNPALADAISRGYDFGAYTPEQLAKATIQSISRGNWTTTNGKGWNGSEDLAFKQATKGMTDAEINALSTEQLAQLMRNTDAYKNTSKWLKNSDNALLYLNTLLGDRDTPEVAKEYARKFVQDGKWKNGFTYDYGTVFGKDGKGVRETNPGTYWHSVAEANRDNIVKNLVYDRDKDTWEDIIGDIPADWRLNNTYAWNDPTSQYTYNYYMRPGREFHRVEGHTDYLDGTPDTWRGVGKETRRETLPNGDTVIYHADAANGNGSANGDIVPVLRKEWPRYAGLLGPAAGIVMQALNVGKPSTKNIGASLESLNNVALASPEHVGGYYAYRPDDPFFDDIIASGENAGIIKTGTNTAAPIGNKQAFMLSADRNFQDNVGRRRRESQRYNNTERLTALHEQKDTDKWNAAVDNEFTRFNTEVLNRNNQLRAQLGMQAAAQKADMDAGWYNGIYGNVAGLFKGISDIGRENAERNMLARLAASGALGTIDPEGAMNAGLIKYADSVAEGGKIKRKKNKRRGLTI